jgi:competence protein ComEC
MQPRWRRRVHVSWHIAWLSGGVLGGAAIAPYISHSLFAGLQWLILACALFLLTVLHRGVALIVVSVTAGLLLGAWRGTIEQRALATYRPYYKQQVTLRGKVSEDTVMGQDGNQRIRLKNVRLEQQNVPGEVWISTPAKAAIKRGDIVTFEGTLNDGFGNLPAAMSRARLVSAERPQPGDVARRIRDWFAKGVRQGIPEPEASLGVGYLVGQRSTLPEQLDDNLRILGLTHVVVASGYNLTILVRFARRALAGISKYLATLSASAMIASFVLVTGFSPSMSRAALVTGLSLAAWYYGRKIQPMVLLPFAAAITVLINPAYVWGDIGWYLSFASFAGVIIVAPLLHFYFSKKKQGAIRQVLVETTSAQILTMPIIAYTFAQYAPLALPANLLILPLIPLTMTLTFIVGIAGVIVPAVAVLFGLPASTILHYMTSVTNTMAALPFAHQEINFGLPALLISYSLLLLLIIGLWRKSGPQLARYNIVD